MEQLSLRAATTEAHVPRARAPQEATAVKPESHSEEQPLFATNESLCAAMKTPVQLKLKY